MAQNRQKRLKALTLILREESISNQDELIAALAEKGFEIKQSAISKDLKALGYEKHPENGYIKTDEKAFTEVEDILSRLLSYANPKFRLARTKDSTKDKKMYVLYIYTKEGLENSISELIYIFYNDRVISTVAGHGCVTVHLPDKSLAHKIKSELEEYASRIL